jgi:hypothetical protein
MWRRQVKGGRLCVCALLLIAAGPAVQQPLAKAPEVTGAWTGAWGPYNPAQSPTLAKEHCKTLDCQVVLKDGVWQATFEGECGRPYKYIIKMEGRRAGGAVLFKGTTDLGEKDGGVFDWVGRATDAEFVGFYTSERYTGVFHLARRK